MPRTTPRATPKAKAPTKPSKTFATADEAVAELEHQYGKRTTAWTYKDADGNPIGLVVRWDMSTGKNIRPVSKTAAGWIIRGMAEPRPLYRLPELLTRKAEPVYITEGEKCADTLAGLGLLATTSSHGSKSAGKADWTPLAGREIVILPDHDAAGAQYAADVTGLLAKLTPSATVRVVHLSDTWSGLAVGGDIADVIETGEGIDSIKAKLTTLVEQQLPEPSAASVPPAVNIRTFTPFPVEVLPTAMADLVSEGAAALGCDPSQIALPMLAACSAAIGNSRRIMLKTSWSEPAVLWTVTVLPSGSLKSPAMDLAIEPIRKEQARAIVKWKGEMAEYRTRCDEWNN